ncbi:hypothetical protein MUP01_04275 [Candidatus Bathyarchaeota archaeon]|jgi:uncharacterized membrane protein|nr:hypothetical protein [Candidatus Bathyarchaeota archaeon]
MSSAKIAIIVTFCALSIATNYALIGVSNVKLMDLIVFLGGFLFGPVTGSLIGIFSWLIYGSINPIGFVPQIWLATMFAESVYGITGGFLRKALGSTSLEGQRFRLSVLFATMGFLPTALYDMTTNVVYASVFNVPIAVAIFAGAPFTVLHEVANGIIFGVCSVPVITVIGKITKERRI